MHNFAYAGFASVTEEVGMNVVAFLHAALLDFDRDAMSLSACVLTNPRYLPGNHDIPLVGADGELAIRDWRSDHCLGKLTYGGELIAEVAIQSLKPIGEGNDRRA